MSIERLREIAEAVERTETYAGHWSYTERIKPNHPQGKELLVGSDSEMGTIADVVPWMRELAEHIAAFDPPTVLALLDVAEAADIGLEGGNGWKVCRICSREVDYCRPLCPGPRMRDALDRLREVTA